MSNHPLHNVMEQHPSHAATACRQSEFVQTHDDAVLRLVGREVTAKRQQIFIYRRIFSELIDLDLRCARLACHIDKRRTGLFPEALAYHMFQSHLHAVDIRLAGNLRCNEFHRM